jgi:ubiquinone/menaquinone biosynthesis C-methylase UbiE
MSEIKDIYDQIAPSWYNYRHRTRFRSELEEMAQRWQRGRLLNIGCAHGPDFLPFTEGFELNGIDISPGMLEMGRQYAEKFGFKVNLTEADAADLPFPDESYDFAIAVAVYHHIEEKEKRLKALKGLYRVLKPGGEAFITVWNRYQPRFWRQRKNIRVPWRSGEKVLQRYYYLFSYGEIKRLVRKAGLRVLKASPEKAYSFPLKYFSRNICLLVRKPDGG